MTDEYVLGRPSLFVHRPLPNGKCDVLIFAFVTDEEPRHPDPRSSATLRCSVESCAAGRQSNFLMLLSAQCAGRAHDCLMIVTTVLFSIINSEPDVLASFALLIVGDALAVATGWPLPEPAVGLTVLTAAFARKARLHPGFEQVFDLAALWFPLFFAPEVVGVLAHLAFLSASSCCWRCRCADGLD